MAAIAESARILRAPLLTPGHPGYDEGRRAWNLAVDQHPAAVLMPESASDVLSAVRFAREHDLPIAVQGTGHGLVTACDGGLLINTSRMKDVTVYPQTRTARVQAGVQWKEVIADAQRFGLAPLSGSSPGVGVVGYTLGGGTGWLARQYGYAADSLVSVDIVTANGDHLRASTIDNAELFWGLRGGSGNFGVVTALEFRLYPVAHMYGGGIFYAFEHGAPILSLFREWVDSLPDSITSRVAIIDVPPLPFVPEPIRGRRVIALQACFLGDTLEGERLLRPFRQLARPLLDTFRIVPYTEVGTIANDPVDPHTGALGTELLSDITPHAIHALLEAARQTTYLRLTDIRHMGGAIANCAENSSAVGQRGARFWMNAVAAGFPLDHKQQAEDDVNKMRRALRSCATGGVLLNGLDQASRTRLKAAYAPENYRRLVALKRRYDPDNIFRFNHNIPRSVLA